MDRTRNKELVVISINHSTHNHALFQSICVLSFNSALLNVVMPPLIIHVAILLEYYFPCLMRRLVDKTPISLAMLLLLVLALILIVVIFRCVSEASRGVNLRPQHGMDYTLRKASTLATFIILHTNRAPSKIGYLGQQGCVEDKWCFLTLAENSIAVANIFQVEHPHIALAHTLQGHNKQEKCNEETQKYGSYDHKHQQAQNSFTAVTP